jgi:hypothetical protein
MPTLRPQRLSGLVVTPTVESVPGLHTVSIAIDVGMSRTPPPQVVNREDLVVELRNPAEGSFEPIASPDPGPLPVRAIRVEQARAEFTFAQGVNAPTDLKVTLLGDQKTFQLSQTFSPTHCLGREPKEGGPFQAPGKHIPFLTRAIPPFLRPRCCPGRLDAPHNPSTDPAAKSESFEAVAAFRSQGRGCRCSCCEYRQFVRGTFTDANGADVRFDMPSGPLDPSRYCEDGAIDEFGTGRHGFYGHRDTSTPGDEYGGTGGSKGCAYRSKEKPSCPPSDTVHLEFLGLIIDRCRGTVVAKRTWTVDL